MPQQSSAVPGESRTNRDRQSALGCSESSSPQTTPVWVDYRDGEVWVNSAVGRQKDRNVKREPRVALAIVDPDNPYRYVEVRGRVREITQDGADAHIDAMAKKYLGQDTYPYRQPGEQRVIYKIEILKTVGMG